MTQKPIVPNPQGKGLSPVLDSLAELKRNTNAPPKQLTQVAAELFTALFILESQIRFKPVLERQYWLYLKNGNYHLSLINPSEWSEALAGQYVGECQLHTDLTWSLTLSAETLKNGDIMDRINQRRALFEQQLTDAECLEQALPVYVNRFSFYSRALGSALAYSLSASMHQTGIDQLTYNDALQHERALALTLIPEVTP